VEKFFSFFFFLQLLSRAKVIRAPPNFVKDIHSHQPSISIAIVEDRPLELPHQVTAVVCVADPFFKAQALLFLSLSFSHTIFLLLRISRWKKIFAKEEEKKRKEKKKNHQRLLQVHSMAHAFSLTDKLALLMLLS
jgi:hypothetical protein